MVSVRNGILPGWAFHPERVTAKKKPLQAAIPMECRIFIGLLNCIIAFYVYEADSGKSCFGDRGFGMGTIIYNYQSRRAGEYAVDLKKFELSYEKGVFKRAGPDMKELVFKSGGQHSAVLRIFVIQ